MEAARDTAYQLVEREAPRRRRLSLPEPERATYADAMRVAATLGVVALHTVYLSWVMFSYNEVSRAWWLTGDVVNSLFRWCVPAFVMISGMLLLDPRRDEPLRLFFRKRMSRVLIPFLFWTALYSLWALRYVPELLAVPKTYRDIAVGMAEGPVFYHLWFLYMIIGLYLVTPILRPYVKAAGTAGIPYFLVLWAVVAAGYGLVGRFAHVQAGITIEMVGGMVGYFVLGYYLNNVEVSLKQRRLLYLLALVSIAVTASGTWYLTARHAGGFDDYFFGYLSPTTMVVSAAVFLFFKYVRWDRAVPPGSRARARLLRWSQASFGVYLVHALVLDALMYARVSANLVNPLFGVPLTVGLTLVLSYALTRLLQSLPYARRLVG
jgi:surface polysaccharide O-acyltransferase-like enzyme